jgi:hypothetical protein
MSTTQNCVSFLTCNSNITSTLEFKSSEMWRIIAGQTATDASNDRNAFILRIKNSSQIIYLVTEMQQAL